MPIGEILAGAVVKQVISMLVPQLWGQMSLLRNFEKDLAETKKTLETLQVLLEDAENQSFKEVAVSRWLKRLKFAAYDFEDLLCDFGPRDPVPVKSDWLPKVRMPSVLKNQIMANKMKQKRKKLMKIASLHQNLKFTSGRATEESNEEINRKIISYLPRKDGSIVVGRDSDKEEVLKLLLESRGKNNICTICITGHPGVGKSTLARFVFDDGRVERKFETSKFWVHVSEPLNLEKIGMDILNQTDKYRGYSSPVPNVPKLLKEVLCERAYLIVLDNLWAVTGKDWDDLSAMLQGDKSGSRIMVTTRYDMKASSTDDSLFSRKLEMLSNEDCWKIFSAKAFGPSSAGSSQLTEIGWKIVEKCKGLPLAAESIGYAMSRKEGVQSWKNVLDSNIWDLEGDKVLPSLMLSYYQLLPPLKLCFAYCAIFPKGKGIDRDILIQEWIALGFIHGNSNVLECTGLEYIMELLRMSFFHVSGKYGAQREIYIHDLMHDLAIFVAKDEVGILDAKGKTNDAAIRNTDYRYARLDNYSDNIKNKIVLPKKVRAIHFEENSHPSEIPTKIFAKAKCLRIIRLNQCITKNIPDEVSHLKLLQFLKVSHHIELLPKSINTLYTLQVLDLSNSHIRTFSPGNCLSKLHHLNLSNCPNLENLPDPFNNFQELVYLNLSNCPNLKLPNPLYKNSNNLLFLDLSTNSHITDLSGILLGLKKLEYLNISQCCNLQILPDELGRLVNLGILDLSWCENLVKLPKTFGNLENLKELHLHGCTGLEVLPDSFPKLGNLSVLDLSWCATLELLPKFIGELTKLEDLNLSGCSDIKKIPDSITNVKKLRVLNLSNCTQLKQIPRDLYNMSLLLTTEGCHVLTQNEPISLMNLEASTSKSGNYCKQTRLGNDHELRITYLDSVGSSSTEYEEVQSLEIKSEVHYLELCWPNTLRSQEYAVEDEAALEKLSSQSNLVRLRMENYRGTNIPTWVMSLQTLARLTLCNLVSCTNLPPLWQLSNLNFLRIENMPQLQTVLMKIPRGEKSFERLLHVQLCDLEKLVEWSLQWEEGSSPVVSGVKEPNFPVLWSMQVERCPKLIFKPFIPMSMSYVIKGESALLSRGGQISVPMSLNSEPSSKLEIKDCSLPPNGWEGLKSFQKVAADLAIDSFHLESLPDSIQMLNSIKYLEIKNCSKIKNLPEWFVGLNKLRMLYIHKCQNLCTLPEKIEHLQALRVTKCGEQLVNQYTKDHHRRKILKIRRVFIEADGGGSVIHWS